MGEPGQVRCRFPLPVLAYGADPKTRLLAMVDWCVVVLGRERQQAMDAKGIREAIKTFDPGSLPGGFHPTWPDHQIVVLGMQALWVRQGNVSAYVEAFRAVESFLEAFTARHGKQPWVSIGNNLVWEVIHGSGISWREFSTLCGLYSWIGGRKRAWVTRSVIACRAMGYKSAAVMEAELPSRTDGEKPFTTSQINRTLDRLHERGFFARQRADPWHTYYSLSMDQDGLEKAIIGSATFEAEFHQRRVARSADFMEKLKAARRANVNTPNVNNGQNRGSRDVHAAPTPALTLPLTLAPFTPALTVLNPCAKPLPLLQNPSQKTRSTLGACSAGVSAFEENPEKAEEIREREAEPPGEPEFEAPTLPKVAQFFDSLRKAGGQRAGEWFDKHGTDPKWATTDWRKAASRWLLERGTE